MISPKIENILIVVGFLVFCTPSLLAQNCDNIGFDNGTFSGWEAQVGLIDSDGTGQYGNIIDPASEPERFAVVSDLVLDGTTEGGCPSNAIYSRNSESSFSARLGNPEVGAQMEKLIKRLNVTESTALLIYRFAVVFQDPGHPPEEQPRFIISVKDKNGNVLPCGMVDYTAGVGLPGFASCSDEVLVRDWNSAAIDLSPYINQEIVLEFETKDCSQGGHFGYAYFDVECVPLAFIPLNYCEGEPAPDSVIITAPSGFNSYLWDDGGTTSAKTVFDLNPNIKHDVTMTSDNGCSVSISNSILPNNITSSVSDLSATLCTGELSVLELTGDDVFFYMNESKQDTIYSGLYEFVYMGEASQKFYSTGKGGCFLDSFMVVINAIDTPVFNVHDTLFGCENANSTIALQGLPNSYIVNWSNGSSGFSTQYDMSTVNPKEWVAVKADDRCKTFFDEEFEVVVWSVPELNLQFGLRDSCPIFYSEVMDFTPSIVKGDLFLNQVKQPFDRDNGSRIAVKLFEPGNYSLHYLGETAFGCILDTLIESAFTVYPTTPVELRADRVILGDTLDTWRIADYSQGTYALDRKWQVDADILQDFGNEIYIEYDNRFDTKHLAGLVRMNEFGCTDSNTILVDTYSASLYSPTAFSPNGDGDNENYLPSCHNCIETESYYQIINRWGEIIYEADFTTPWNGIGFDGRQADKGQYSVQIVAKYINLFIERKITPLVILR